MENVTINITGDVHIHINLDDLDDFFEDDEFDEDFDDDNGDSEDDEACGIDGPSIMIDGLPEDIDREAVEAVIEITCNILDTLIEKAAASRKGESDEGV